MLNYEWFMYLFKKYLLFTGYFLINFLINNK
jgi:hypothetical protein